MRAEERRFASGDFWGGDPHPALAWMREHDPVPFDDEAGVWGVTRYDDIKAVSTQPAVFSSAGGIRPDTGTIPMMIDMEDPDHMLRRLLVRSGLTHRSGRVQ